MCLYDPASDDRCARAGEELAAATQRLAAAPAIDVGFEGLAREERRALR
jgi:hypothetical protein